MSEMKNLAQDRNSRERREDRGSPVPHCLGIAGEFVLDMVVVERGVVVAVC